MWPLENHAGRVMYVSALVLVAIIHSVLLGHARRQIANIELLALASMTAPQTITVTAFEGPYHCGFIPNATVSFDPDGDACARLAGRPLGLHVTASSRPWLDTPRSHAVPLAFENWNHPARPRLGSQRMTVDAIKFKKQQSREKTKPRPGIGKLRRE